MKIYTKTGDSGETGLFGGGRVSKDHPRVDAYGAVDELNAALGLAACAVDQEDLRRALESVQSELFVLGADLATPDGVQSTAVVRLEDHHVTALEHQIDAWEAALPPLTSFILPGGTEAAARLHLARTICRRAERRVTALGHQEHLGELPVRYLNRLSDWLFVLARTANARAGVPDRPWISPRQAAQAGESPATG